ncbi:MAG: hypothetical protein LBE91_07150 [Tannerella sp.]|jgi:hypothetical protein|nr:hypothetical protein [Tannerella sp.]
MENIYEVILSNILPSDILKNFVPVSISEKQYGVALRMEERETNLPIELSGIADLVKDGFCNAIELLHFHMKGKPLYLQLYRRRWKQSGSSRHYSNHYNLHPEGVKATHEFAAFLKESGGITTDEYVHYLIGAES